MGGKEGGDNGEEERELYENEDGGEHHKSFKSFIPGQSDMKVSHVLRFSRVVIKDYHFFLRLCLRNDDQCKQRA